MEINGFERPIRPSIQEGFFTHIKYHECERNKIAVSLTHTLLKMCNRREVSDVCVLNLGLNLVGIYMGELLCFNKIDIFIITTLAKKQSEICNY